MSYKRISKTPNNQVDSIKGVSFFSVRAEYGDLISKYSEVLQYLTYNSEYFSLITRNKKPYSNRPPICIHDEMLEPLKPFLVHQEVGIRKWADNNSNDNHTVLNIYSCGKAAFRVLCTYDNLFLYSGREAPEDLCFYRGDQVWFNTVIHEQLAFLTCPKKQDLQAFMDCGIRLRFDNSASSEQYPVFHIFPTRFE